MKRGWLAAGLLAAMVAVALWNVAELEKLTGELNTILAQAETSAEEGNWRAAGEQTARAKACWQAHSGYLHILLDHEVTDEIDLSFGEVAEFIECEEGGEYSAANARLMESIRRMGALQTPRLENLL